MGVKLIISGDPVKESTVAALRRVLDPLLELMFDTGVTVQELNQIARDRAVRIATLRVIKEGGRESKSRVAILTGLPRSEVTRILNSPDRIANAKPGQHPARRVLAAWHDNPRYLDPSGEPAVMSIFGRKRSFERLVAEYGMGIPVRAMLDELTQLNAVERLADQRVRAKARVPILTGLSSRSITAVGERGRDLLETLTHNMRQTSPPLFEAAALVDDGDFDRVALVRREIAEQGTHFINAATSLLNRARVKRGTTRQKPSKACRIGVAVYYFQDDGPDGAQASVGSHGPRKNLRRHPVKPRE